MLVTNELEPLAKLSGVSNGGGERQDGAVGRADDALQSVALGTIERVNLVEDEVGKREACGEPRSEATS